MHRANVLSLLTNQTWGIIDALRIKNSFREYARGLAERMGIDTKKGYWSTTLNEKAPLIKDVWAIIDLVREYIEISAPKKAIEWTKLLTDAENAQVAELVQKMQAKLETEADVPPTPEQLFGQD